MAARANRTPIGQKDDHTDDEQRALEIVLKSFSRADKLHALLRPRWNLYYGLYRNYRKLGNDLGRARNERDRDTITQEFVRVFGAELFIPFAFATVETVQPRVMSTNPEMLALPIRDEADESIKAVQAVYARDQKAIKYGLKLQDIAKSGLLYGLGVGKVHWDERYRKGKKLKKGLLKGEHVVEDRKLVYAGPQMEAIDIFDFFWDPTAKDIETCDYAIHRTWRTTQYVNDRVKSGKWLPLDMEKVSGMASDSDRGGIWEGRHQAAGMSNAAQSKGELHEVLEYHDRDKVYTVLDRQLLVQDAENPHHHGDLPFQIYRPTRVPDEFCGIGEIEPIAHLQFELNTMRSQRRDAATLALNRGYFYQKGSIQPRDMVTGPGAFVPTMTDPREAIYPMPIQDIPASSVSEEEALKSDITLTSGISETVAGTSDTTSSTTATSVQLVQQAAGQRITLKSQNMEEEIVQVQAEQFRELYIQKTPEKPSTVRVADETTPGGYSFIKISRKDFENVEMTPASGSMSPENEAEKKASAIQFSQSLAPLMDVLKPEKIAEYMIGQFGVKNPQSYINEAPPQEDPGTSAGGLPELIQRGLVEGGMPEKDAALMIETVSGKADATNPQEFVEAVMSAMVAAGMDPGQATDILAKITQQQPGPEEPGKAAPAEPQASVPA